MENVSHYSQWGLVLIMVTLFGWFVFRHVRPRKKREWRNSGLFAAFLVALFAEMYGFPLTIYILSSVFGIDIPFTHIKGHLWATLLGLGESGAMIEMLIGYLIIGIGALLILAGWKKIYQGKGSLVTDGIYKHVRHPQYAGIILITIGMIVHWPTLFTLLLWPVLTLAYYKLAKREEKELEIKLGKPYRQYLQETPMFIPRKRNVRSFAVNLLQNL